MSNENMRIPLNEAYIDSNNKPGFSNIVVPVAESDKNTTLLATTKIAKVIKTLENPTKPKLTESFDYEALKTQHAELIKQGKTSVEIATWMGKKLNITPWQTGVFHGERKVLPTPQSAEMERLQKFTEALGIQWTKANGSSDNHLTHLLLNGYVQNALFGKENMKANDAKLTQTNTDWEKMGTNYVEKAYYLLTQFGLDIKGDWTKLSGVRYSDGFFDYSDGLYASGSLDGRDVRRMWLNQHSSNVDFFDASGARLCFLA